MNGLYFELICIVIGFIAFGLAVIAEAWFCMTEAA